MTKLFLLFLLTPIIELIVFFKVNEVIGTSFTVFTVIITAIFGTILVHRQAKGLIGSLREKNINLMRLIGNGLLILVAGILLLTPGFITDILGFFILIPAIRHRIIIYLEKKYNPS
jgi:UPF0716 protein FxsA